jgi:hypothetical protein
MFNTPGFTRPCAYALAAAILTALGASPCLAGSDFKDELNADPQGSVEVDGIAGRIEIIGWDQPKIQATGSSDLADRVHIQNRGMRTLIDVRPRDGIKFGSDDTRLTIRIPMKNSIAATWVSADIKVTNIMGDADLRTVSGNITGDVGGDLRVNTSTGDVKMTATGADSIEIRSISGDIQLSGGSAQLELTTVSGNAKVELATLKRGRVKSISGDLTGHFALAPEADLEGESVSGTVRLNFAAQPAASYMIETISGKIDNCFGPKVDKAQYGPGARLDFKSGAGKAHVRIETKSGDIHMCAPA